MDKSDRSLVPEWLRSTGSATGGGSSTQQLASSSFIPENQSRSRSSKSKSDLNSPRSSYFDRTASSNSRRVSSNGSAKHAYSSFSRNNRDKDRERDKDRLSSMDIWEHDSSDPIGGFLSGRDKDPLRRSISLVPRKHGEPLLRKDLKNGGSNYHSNSNGILPGPAIGSGTKKAAFEKDFPSLGNEDRQGVPDVVRVSSPGVGSAVQSLTVGSSALIGGEGWTSALAEVPNVIGGRSTSSLSASLSAPVQTSSSAPTGATGLNMAEALAQAPSRARTPPEASGKTQRLEELAIRQSKQLIPVTPSMPKGSVLNPSDKLKVKGAARPGDMVHGVSKGGPQQPHAYLHVNQSVSSGMKSDSLKTSHGKLLILKPSWENGASQASKEAVSPTNSGNGRAASNQPAAAPLVSSTPTRIVNSPKDRKASSANAIPGLTLEKKPFLSQSQSRNDFFNLLKKQNSTHATNDLSASENASSDLSTSTNASTDLPSSTSVPADTSTYLNTVNDLPASSPVPSAVDKPEILNEVDDTPEGPHAAANGTEVISECDVGKGTEVSSAAVENNVNFDLPGYPNEKEYAFLRSLGWEENNGEEGGLTEEEIMSFYEECKKRKPMLKLCAGLLPKLAEMEAAAVGGASSELKSSSSGSSA